MTPTYDLVIVGGGNAGLAAATAAGERGLRTLVLEKRDEIGGQLHWSSGQFSAAGTRRQRARGISDHPDHHFEDVMRIGHGLNNADLVRMAVDAAPAAVDRLDDMDFPFADEVPAFVSGHELYTRPRTYWGGSDPLSGGLAILESLSAAVASSPTVEVRTGAEVRDLTTRREGSGTRAVGVVLEDGREIGARLVVLATGGYAASRELVAELQPRHASALTGCMDHATGDGHRILMSHGVTLTHGDTYVPTMGMIADPSRAGYGLRLKDSRVVVDAIQRPPWEIWVNSAGRRFVAEDDPSPFVREAALRLQAGLAMWVIWDVVAMRSAPPVIGPNWKREEVVRAAARGSWIRSYRSLRALAEDHHLPLATLEKTIDEYNRAETDPFGRTHRPRPIARAPYYAVRVVGGMLLSRGGPQVDERLRPLGPGGHPIRGLRAVGELLGMGQFSGDSFAGGMSVGPALALGRLVVERAAMEGLR